MEIVIITGGAGALGSTVARTLVARGDKVVLLDIPAARERLKSLATELACVGLTADVASASSWSETLKEIESSVGAPTGAALIAGGWDGGKPLHESDDASWEKMRSMNLDTAYRSIRALLPGMVAHARGSIVVVGSRAVERPWESANAAAYAATKSAVVAMARAAAAEVMSHHVRINAVLPSIIDTPANRASMPKADPSKWVSGEGLAKVIGFLLSEDAREVTGAALPVYGRT
jgi:NAD(P)-dependent dehydrogenase (short-subunit alcohol dehydrogenase family)